MKLFKLDKEYQIVCEFKNTKQAFKHEATLLKNNCAVCKTKIIYCNRTWERFTYESVLKKIIPLYFENTKDQKKYYNIIYKFN